MPDFLFDFQRDLVAWDIRKGIGMELKPTYYRQAVKNVAAASEAQNDQLLLLNDARSGK